ncbi:hypothetical protein DW075_08365 [Bacteroides xylanisolvens]|uniref:Uncharacterized protein n=1 Tax=Bacteroides xylanisolvens TaxID=371601 RepID=A0A415FY70_9BACE|nr:hypothetical protein GFH35_18235 [Bacteroides xylanisolvens]RHK27979.1 hypothetical protein DW075_08365 [Bacteroides xylanisolvens]
MCQNSPFYEVTLATDNCSEGDFLFIRVLTQPPREHFMPQDREPLLLRLRHHRNRSRLLHRVSCRHRK